MRRYLQITVWSVVLIPLFLVFTNAKKLDKDKKSDKSNKSEKADKSDSVKSADDSKIADFFTRHQLAKDTDCGSMTTKFTIPKSKRVVEIIKSPDKEEGKEWTWHNWNGCMKAIRSAALKQVSNPKAPIHDLYYSQILFLINGVEKNGKEVIKIRFYKAGNNPKYLSLNDVINKDESLDHSKFDRVVTLNNNGIPFSAFEQIDFGLLNLTAYSNFTAKNINDHRVKSYRALGLASILLVTDTVGSENGLRTRSTCGLETSLKCSWFHSMTNRDGKSSNSGATLNKHLHAVRDLFRAAEILNKLEINNSENHKANKKQFIQASVEGMQQLVYQPKANKKHEPPNIFDFVPLSKSGKPIQRSWFLYGYNTESQNAYYLNPENGASKYKNCGYHIHDYELLVTIIEEYAKNQSMILDLGIELVDYDEIFYGKDKILKKHVELPSAFLPFMKKAHAIKVSEGLSTNGGSVTKGGNFGPCDTTKVPEELE